MEKLIVGLGNPGPSYARTRHNVGRRVVEELAREFHTRWKEARDLRSQWAEVKKSESSFFLALPDSYMNESGGAIERLLSHFEIDFKSNLLVVVDDVALPFGGLRLRASGQDGGHRGLRSIEETLASSAYARLRIGIKPSEELEVPLEEYVLSPFSAKEERALDKILKQGTEACRKWLTQSIERAMDWTNKPLS